MGYSPDVLVTALQELVPGWTDTFTKWHPAFEAMILKGTRKKLKGPWAEFVVVPSGPGVYNNVDGGNEKLLSSRRQGSVRGNAFCHTGIYGFKVPLQDLRDADDKADLGGIIKSYPERAMLDVHEILAKQLVVGGTEARGMITLNGDRTYNPRGLGARAGVFEFADADSQSATVFGVRSNTVLGWHSQHREVASFSSDGLRQIRQLKWDIQEQVAAGDQDADLAFVDRGTFANLMDRMDSDVVITERSYGDTGPRGPSKFRKGVQFEGTMIFQDQYIKATEFTTAAAQEGCGYFVNSAPWVVLYQAAGGSLGSLATDGDFAMRGPTRIPDEDAILFEIVVSLGLYTPSLRDQGSLVGGARE